MNSRQLRYAILLSEIRNYSQVAEKLNITQPALSKQILNLEGELGVKLFDRNTTPLELTPAGRYFIQEAQELLYKEDQLVRTMERFKSGDEGQLVIGITPFRSSYLIADIVKKVREKYPGIQVKLHEAGSDILRKEAVEGRFDFAVINLPVDDSVLEVRPIEPDRLVLAVPNDFVKKFPQLQGVQQIDFSQCKELPFVVVGPSQEMRRLFDKICAAADFRPNIAAEVVSLTTAWSMACAGVAATLLPLQFVSRERFEETLTIIEIKDITYPRQPAIVTKRGQFLSDCAKYAIELLTKSDSNLQ